MPHSTSRGSKKDIERVWIIVRDRTPRTAIDVVRALQDRFGIIRTTAAVTARIRDLRKPQFGQHNVQCYRNGRTAYYVLIPNTAPEVAPAVAA